MPSDYPGQLDSFVNPTDTDTLDNPSHSALHTDANDAIEAVQGELGINPRGPDADVRARLDRLDVDSDGASDDDGLETITASTSYAANGVVQLSVTIDHEDRVLIHHSCLLRANGATNLAAQSVEVSGSNTIAASGEWGAKKSHDGFAGVSRSHLFTGLTPGTSTFTLVYQSGDGTDTGSVREKSLVVEAL